MSAIIFDGRAEARTRKEELKKRVTSLRERGIIPKLVSFYLAKDEGSALYTRIKRNAAIEVGIEFDDIELGDSTDIERTVAQIKELNEDTMVHGILIQKPSGVNNFSEEDWEEMVSAIDPLKDVDGLTPENLGLVTTGNPRFLPATVKAVLSVLDHAHIQLPVLDTVLDIVIIGDTDILGKPLAEHLKNQGVRVIVANKFTEDLGAVTKNADVLVSATGVPDLISKDMVKEGAVVIDVGEPKGDVQEDVREVASFLSPVPGGVGPLTVVSLLENTVEAAFFRRSS